MSVAREVKSKDVPVLVQSPYNGAMYNLQPMFHLMEHHYFFQEIEKVSDELDEVLLFVTQNTNGDADGQNLAKILAKVLLIKEFFKILNSSEM